MGRASMPSGSHEVGVVALSHAMGGNAGVSFYDCRECFRIKRNGNGWRVQLGHRALVDLGGMDEASGEDTGCTIRLSSVLPTGLFWPYFSNVDPELQGTRSGT